jgi:hypothetical protein
MEIVLIIGGLFILYQLMSRQNATTQAEIAALGARSTASVSTQAATINAGIPMSIYPGAGGGPGNGTALIGSGVDVGLQAGESVASSAAQAGSAVAGAFATAIPIVGVAFNAIFGSLMAASAKRAAEARSENQAVNAGVAGWDNAVAQVIAAYNAGQITLTELYQFMGVPQVNDPTLPSSPGLLWKNYWREVGPQVQPGRNGCQTGTATQPTTQSWCSGSYGAGCCVGYDDLKNSSVYIMQAARKAESRPGVSVPANVLVVVASKYGAANRPAYTVTLKKPTSGMTYV